MPPHTIYRTPESRPPPGYRTPSPPFYACESFSNVPARHPHPLTESRKEYTNGSREFKPSRESYHAQPGNSPYLGRADPNGNSQHSLNNAHLNAFSKQSLSRSHHQHSASKMDTLAAAVEALSPTFAVPTLEYGATVHVWPRTYWQPGRGSPSHPASHDHYRGEGPPWKRARSEVTQSVQALPGMSRPATSHVPHSAWFYTGAQVVDAVFQPTEYQTISQRASADEAELLLGLSVGRKYSVPKPTCNGQYGASSEQQPSVYHNQRSAEVRDIMDGDSSKLFGHTLNEYIRASEQPNYQGPPGSIFAEPEAFTAPDTSTVKLSGPLTAAEPAGIPEINSIISHFDFDNERRTSHPGFERPKQVGWPKGKPRKARTGNTSARKPIKVTTALEAGEVKPADDHPTTYEPLEAQLTQIERAMLPTEQTSAPAVNTLTARLPATFLGPSTSLSKKRRSSDSNLDRYPQELEPSKRTRVGSVPPDNGMIVRQALGQSASPVKRATSGSSKVQADTVCEGCKFSRNSLNGERELWVGCNGCKGWFHYACAGFKNEREVGDVDKYHCRMCKAKHGPTTFVRKSARAHTSVDYARLQEGVVTTSRENPEHHYIQSFKEGKFKFQAETFPRMRPELVTAEYFERCRAMKEPIVIPAVWNPRPSIEKFSSTPSDHPDHEAEPVPEGGCTDSEATWARREYQFNLVPDEGQDGLDMVIPQGLTVRRVAELYGPDERVEVIDVKMQEGEDKRWNMKKWADYYETSGEKVVRNVISLEVSQSKLGRLIRRPKVVRDLDLQDSVWPPEETAKGNQPRVQFYCLMSVENCYTDFHIDFGGSSVYYHILKGKKTFFFIPPTTQHLRKYQDWCLSPAQNHTFLPDQTKECYRVDLSEGDTMLIPSGWIHAVWTPENSLVIGGNFLTRLHYGMQIKVAEIEKATKVPRKFRYPQFQKVLWYALIRYLEQDPVPRSVKQGFCEGQKFHRERPLYYGFDTSGGSAKPGQELYNARYYPQAELDNLPDLVRYIFRTVMISLGKVEGITNDIKNAVTRAIPKGHGEPLELCKEFAMWTAWKRGNEDIPEWAHQDAELPSADNGNGEKKLTAASLKRLERRAPDRQSLRRASRTLETNADGSILVPGSSSRRGASQQLNTPKTSVLGPARVACDSCRKRRIRCKHKDVTSPPSSQNNQIAKGVVSPITTGVGADTVTLPNDTNLVGNEMQQAVRATSPGGPTLVAVVINRTPNQATEGSVDGTPTSVSSARPKPHVAVPVKHGVDDTMSKVGRNRACLECRRSKRRCVHDENGGIDPVKAAGPSVPRGANNTNKRKSHAENDRPRVINMAQNHQLDTLPAPQITMTNDIETFDGSSYMYSRQSQDSSAQQLELSYTGHMGPAYTPNMTVDATHEAPTSVYSDPQSDPTTLAGLPNHKDTTTAQSNNQRFLTPHESAHEDALHQDDVDSNDLACVKIGSREAQPLQFSMEQVATAMQQEPTPPEDGLEFDIVQEEDTCGSKDSPKPHDERLPSPDLEKLGTSETTVTLLEPSAAQECNEVQHSEINDTLECPIFDTIRAHPNNEERSVSFSRFSHGELADRVIDANDEANDQQTAPVEDRTMSSPVKKELSLLIVPTSNETMEVNSDEELSSPCSPLTEISMSPPRSDVPGIFGDLPELAKVQRHSSRQIKQVERFVDQVFEGSYESRSYNSKEPANLTAAPDTLRRSTSVTVKPTGPSTAPRHLKTKLPLNDDVRSRTVSAAATDPDEEKSLRLARELQEYDFGLRRRSR